MLSNSGLAACVAGMCSRRAHLNPMLPLHPLRLAARHDCRAVLCGARDGRVLILLVLRQLFAREVFSPA
jgi:hypothetical protein